MKINQSTNITLKQLKLQLLTYMLIVSEKLVDVMEFGATANTKEDELRFKIVKEEYLAKHEVVLGSIMMWLLKTKKPKEIIDWIELQNINEAWKSYFIKMVEVNSFFSKQQVN